MKDLHDAMQDMLDFQCSSAQDLADTMSVVCQYGGQANLCNSQAILCSLGLVFA